MKWPAKIPERLSRAALCLFAVCFVALGVVSFRLKSSKKDCAAAVRQMQAAMQERDRLQEENSLLAEKQQETDPNEVSKLYHDLEQNPQLIPISAELGGTMRYYEDTFALFGGRYAYVYAEDGHNAVEMLLQYEKYADGAVAWTLCAYDAGGGWQAD